MGKCRQCGRLLYSDGICSACLIENERNEILAWSQEEMDAAVRKICNEITVSGKLDQVWQLFRHLVNYRNVDTTEIARAAFEKQIFYPGELYKDAPDEVVWAMIEMLQQDDIQPLLADHLLLCLANHGGEAVVRAFMELEQHPRKWREKLYVDPSVYAAEGGWTFDSSNNVIKTNFDRCYPMVEGTMEERAQSPVKICVRTSDKCTHCGHTMVNLMEFDGRDPRLDFLEIKGVIKAKSCLNCIIKGVMKAKSYLNCIIWPEEHFCRYTIDGESATIYEKEPYDAEDQVREEDIEELVSNSYVLGDAPVPLRYAAGFEGGSSVGGFAFWMQDCEIKRCPECGKPMKYLAQIRLETMVDFGGNVYIEICRDCRIMAALYQNM